MGEAVSRHKPADVPWEVLIAEISELYQDELCETAVLPCLPGHELTDQLEISLTNKLFDRCHKVDEHKHFIEYKDLQMTDLPQSGRCQEGFDWVKAEASKTVRIIVNYTSPDRPKKWRIALEDLNKKRYGTGCATDSVSLPDDKFMIKTAAHVVFREDELKQTWVNFFYDGDKNSGGMVKAKAVSFYAFAEKSDVCCFICEVESPEVGRKVRARFFTPRLTSLTSLPRGFKLALCVSHPHGTTKKVSFGEIKSKSEKWAVINDTDLTKVCYVLNNTCDIQEIQDKSVLHFIMKSIYIQGAGITKMIKQLVPSLSDPEEFLLRKLTDQGLVKPPSPQENGDLQKSLSAAKKEMIDKITQKCRNIDPRLSSSEREKQEKKIRDDFISQESLRLPEVWRQKINTVVNELQSLMFVSMIGNQTLETVASHSTISYDIATCPGSSGAAIVCMEKDEDGKKLTVHFATHTTGHGGGTRGNRSGLAGVWTEVL